MVCQSLGFSIIPLLKVCAFGHVSSLLNFLCLVLKSITTCSFQELPRFNLQQTLTYFHCFVWFSMLLMSGNVDETI